MYPPNLPAAGRTQGRRDAAAQGRRGAGAQGRRSAGAQGRSAAASRGTSCHRHQAASAADEQGQQLVWRRSRDAACAQKIARAATTHGEPALEEALDHTGHLQSLREVVVEQTADRLTAEESATVEY